MKECYKVYQGSVADGIPGSAQFIALVEIWHFSKLKYQLQRLRPDLTRFAVKRQGTEGIWMDIELRGNGEFTDVHVTRYLNETI